MVRPGKVDDDGATVMARKIAHRIQSELTYPGQVRVTVLRETRSVEYAK
jgi:ribonuclease Y